MKFELTHDFIAKQVYEKSSAEAKARRKVALIVQRALQRHRDNKQILLSKEDLAEIEIYEATINFSAEEQTFIRRSRAVINRRRNLLISAVITAFTILSILVIWALNEQRKARNEQQQSLATALAAKSYELQMKGDNTGALRFAQYGYQTKDREATRQALFHSFFQRSKYYYHKSVIGDSNAIVAAAFAVQDTPILMTNSLNGNIKFWDQDLNPVSAMPHNHASEKVALAPDGNLLAIARADSTLQIVDRTSGTEGVLIKHSSLIDQVYYAPTDSVILSVTRNATGWLWRSDGTALDTLNNAENIKSAAFTPDGQYILTAGASAIKIWNKQGEFLDNIRLVNPQRIRFFPMQPDDDCYYLVCIHAGTQLKFFRLCVEDGRVRKDQVAQLPEQSRLLVDLDMAKDGKIALTVNYDFVEIWQLQFSNDNELDLLPLGQLKGHIGFINQAVFAPTGERLYTISDDQSIKLWLLSNDSRPFTSIVDAQALGGQALDRILEDPQFLVSKAQNRSSGQRAQYQVWRIDNKIKPKRLLTLEGDDVKVVTSSNGQRLATVAYDETLQEQTLQIWDTSGNRLASGKSKLATPSTLHFLAGDQQLMTLQDNNLVKIWNLQAQAIDSFPLPGDYSAIYPSPVDSTQLALLSDRMVGKSVVSVYDFSSDSLRSFYSTSELDVGGKVKFSPSGQYILSIHFDKIEIWNLEGRLLKSIVSYDESFVDAFFAPSDNYLIVLDGYQALVMDWTKVESQIATIGSVEQAVFDKNQEHILIINNQTNELERWPFSPTRILDKIAQMRIGDLDEEEKKRHGIN